MARWGDVWRATSLQAGPHPLASSRNPTGMPVGRLIHFGKLTLKCKRWTRSGTDVQDCKPAVSGKILCILCIDVNQNYPMRDLKPVSSHQAQACVSGKAL